MEELRNSIALVVLLQYFALFCSYEQIIMCLMSILILIGAHLVICRAEFLPLVLLIPQGVDAVIRASTVHNVR